MIDAPLVSCYNSNIRIIRIKECLQIMSVETSLRELETESRVSQTKKAVW